MLSAVLLLMFVIFVHSHIFFVVFSTSHVEIPQNIYGWYVKSRIFRTNYKWQVRKIIISRITETIKESTKIIVLLLDGSTNIDEKTYIYPQLVIHIKVLKSKYVDENSQQLNDGSPQTKKRIASVYYFSIPFRLLLFLLLSNQIMVMVSKKKWWWRRFTNIIWNSHGAQNTTVWVARWATNIPHIWTLSVF